MHPHLKVNNYIHVPNFLSAKQADTLAQWMFGQERLGLLEKDPRTNFNLFGLAVNNALPFVKVLVDKIPHVSELCGEKVLPTYAYSIIYKNKSMLIPHKDRDACEISITISLSKDHDWPICIKKPDGEEVCLELNPGDAVMYRGCDAEHWRPGMFKGQNFVQTFFHYVLADGERSYAFFGRTNR
jgi:hypothetical protein